MRRKAKKSVKFTNANGYLYDWPSHVKIYDNNDPDYKLFIPEPNQTYKISLKYKSDKRPGQLLYLELRQMYGIDKTDPYDPANTLTEKFVEISMPTDGWQTAETTFTTGDSVSNIALMLCGSRTDSVWAASNVQVWVDDIVIEEINETTVTIHDYDGSGGTEQVTINSTATFEDLEKPYLEDKKFAGYYLDAEFNSPASGVIGSTTDIWAKWEELFKITNSYDDENVEYYERSDGQFTYTRRIVNGVNAAEQNFGVYNVFVADNEFAPESKKSVKFTNANGYLYDWPSHVKIYDNNDADYKLFIPEPNQTYKISLKYKSDKRPGQLLYLELRQLYSIDKTDPYNAANTLAEKFVEISSETDGWQTAETTFKTGDSVSYIALMLCGSRTDSIWPASNVQVWVDDIVIQEYVAPPSESEETEVTFHDYDGNGGTETLLLTKDTLFSELEVPTASGKHFDNWYLDSEFKLAASGAIGETTEVWVKWRTEPDRIVNNWDESNVEYYESMDGSYILTSRNIDGEPAEEKYIGMFNVQVIDNDFAPESKKSVKFTNANGYLYDWPSTIKLYDNNDEKLKLFTPRPNSAYKISLKYKSDSTPGQVLMLQLRRLSDGENIKYVKENILVEEIASIQQSTNGWVTAEAIFSTRSEVSPLALMLCTSSTDNASASNVNVWIDDIVIEEIFETSEIRFDTVGGTEIPNFVCAINETIPSFPVPSKEGYLFDGWYTDADYKTQFTMSVVPDSDIQLYARWKEIADEPYTYESDFESCEVINDGTGTSVYDNFVSEHVEWLNDPVEAYSGDGCLKIYNPGVGADAVPRFPILSFKNPDGSHYEVLEGKRYRATFAFRCSLDDAQRLFFATASQVPSAGLQLKEAVKQYDFSYHPLFTGVSMDAYGIYEIYFIPTETEKLYLFFTDEAAETMMYLDSVKIEPVDETVAPIVKYYDGDNLVSEQFGKAGTWLTDATVYNKTESGLEFAGWYDSEGNQFVDNFFPNKDMNLYAKWVPAEDLSDAKTDWSKQIVIDFEDSANAKAFYGVVNNSYEASTGMFYVADDPENAHSGNGYYKFNNVGVWSEAYNRRFKFYDSNSVGNQVYLDPNSVYKVSYWLNLEKAGTTTIMLAAFDSRENLTSVSYDGNNTLTDADQIKNVGKWVLHESTITTGSEPTTLGMAISGGWITASIDDITVTKLTDVTVSFDSNGGSAVEPITVLAYDYAIAPDMPTREGYTFTAWYSDKELTERFRFTQTPITENITLYAGWTKDFVPETKYETKTEYKTVEEVVPNTPADAELDEKLNITANDKPAENSGDRNVQSNNENNDESGTGNSSAIWIIIAACSAVLLLVIVLLIVASVKKKNRRKI